MGCRITTDRERIRTIRTNQLHDLNLQIHTGLRNQRKRQSNQRWAMIPRLPRVPNQFWRRPPTTVTPWRKKLRWFILNTCRWNQNCTKKILKTALLSRNLRDSRGKWTSVRHCSKIHIKIKKTWFWAPRFWNRKLLRGNSKTQGSPMRLLTWELSLESRRMQPNKLSTGKTSCGLWSRGNK